MIKSIRKNFLLWIIILVTNIIWIPLIMLFMGSFMGRSEILQNIGTIFAENNNINFIKWTWLPQYPTLQPYVELLLDTPQFFKMFWNSCIQVFPIILGQLIIAVPASWSFAYFNFKGKKIIFGLYILLMILPFQITMVSNYLILNKINLLNSHLSLIIPNIFSTLPVFIMSKFFKVIPKSIIEGAKIDGASELDIFFKIALPLGKNGILSSVILVFLECWNNIEQPLTFLKDKSLYPLSLYISNINLDNIGLALVSCLIMLLPALLIFLGGQKYLEQGIASSGIKG